MTARPTPSPTPVALDRDDAPFDAEDPTRPQRAPRPKDAATLILIRRLPGRPPEVLMGQRAKGHVFMPDKWVFPGGRVEREDALAPAHVELTPGTEEALQKEGCRRKPRAFALAAVREVFEETGLVIGRPGGPPGPAPKGWEAYAALNAAPELDRLAFIARAVTPPYRPRRFDARFFMADAEAVLLDDRPIKGDQELLHTEWFTLDQAFSLDLPNITRFVLGEVTARLAGEALRPPFLRWTRQGHVMERL
jgi:8-oxo-dGTP pyrophosphatase MutT (NUDIX family)